MRILNYGVRSARSVITDVQRFLYPGQTPYTRYASGTSYLRDVSTDGDYRVPQLGRCLTLNGSSEYLSRTDEALALTGAMTCCAWIKSTSNDLNQTIACAGYGSFQSYGFSYGYTNGRLGVWHSGAGESVISDALSLAGSWHHVAFSRTGTAGNWTVAFYVDGIAAGGGTTSIDPTPQTTFAIGQFGSFGGFRFSGSLFDVRIYSRALTAPEIALLADWDTLGDASLLTDASLVAHYDLQGNEYDRSGNGHHLTLTGTAGTMRATDSTVKYSFPCEFGYSDGASGVLVPRDDSDTANDVLGNPLDYAGRAPYDGALGGLPHIVFNGSSERASTLTPITFDVNDDWGVSMWFKADTLGVQRILFGLVTSVTNRLGIGHSAAGNFELFTYNGTTIHRRTVAFTDTTSWHHFAATMDSGTVSAWLDGVAVVGTGGNLDPGGTAGVMIGSRLPEATLNPWAGSVFDVRFYLAAISSADAALLYSRSEPSITPTAAWPCSERAGTTLYDATGNGNDLTITTSAIATVRGGNNTINDHNVVYGARKSSTVYIPGQLATALAADGNALTVGRGQMPDDGYTYVNRKPADYPALLQVEDYWGLLDDDEKTGESVAPPKIATDTGTARHTLRTPATGTTYYAEFTYRTTSSNEDVIVPTVSGNTYNFTIDWGDGSATSTVTAWDDADRQHTYATAGDYVVRIVGNCPKLTFYQSISEDQIIAADLGTMLWTDMGSMFQGCGSLGPVVGGNTRYVTSLNAMFANAPLAQPDTSTWALQAVTDIGFMFFNAASANPETSAWVMPALANANAFAENATNWTNPANSAAFWDNGSVSSYVNAFKGATNISNYASIPAAWGGGGA